MNKNTEEEVQKKKERQVEVRVLGNLRLQNTGSTRKQREQL